MSKIQFMARLIRKHGSVFRRDQFHAACIESPSHENRTIFVEHAIVKTDDYTIALSPIAMVHIGSICVRMRWTQQPEAPSLEAVAESINDLEKINAAILREIQRDRVDGGICRSITDVYMDVSAFLREGAFPEWSDDFEIMRREGHRRAATLRLYAGELDVVLNSISPCRMNINTDADLIGITGFSAYRMINPGAADLRSYSSHDFGIGDNPRIITCRSCGKKLELLACERTVEVYER